MKIYISCLFFASVMLFTSRSFSQDPTWTWAKGAGTTSMDASAGTVVADNDGNSYVLGDFAGTSITIGSITLNALVSATVTGDNFLVKYNAAGNVMWAKGLGGHDFDMAKQITLDAFGHLYMVGWFWSDTVFMGSDTLVNTGVAGYPAGSPDIFLAKYDTSGNVIWAKSEGGTLSDTAGSVSTDALGNVYVSGSFNSSSLTLGSTTLTNGGNYDMFIAKYDSSGNALWAHSAGGSLLDYATGVSSDASGNTFVTGVFRSTTITFGSVTLTNTSLPGFAEIFLVKFDASGNVLWATNPEGITGDYANAVAGDGLGNVYVTGEFSSDTIHFGPYTLSQGLGGNFFLAKYDASGNALWAKRAGGPGFDSGLSVASDIAGNAYVTGWFGGDSITFGPAVLHSSSAYKHIFVAQYDGSGNGSWAKSALGNADDIGRSVYVDGSGNIYVAGEFPSTVIYFGSNTLYNIGGTLNMFVAKMNSITTGIEEAYSENGSLIYPNPASGHFRIQAARGGGIIEICNVLGEKVYSAVLRDEDIHLNAKAGIYFVKVNDGAMVYTQKLVIQ